MERASIIRQLRPWIVWGLAAILGLYTFILQGSPSVIIPQLMRTYCIDVVQIGVLTSSFFYTYILMQIPAGILIDLWGPRRLLKTCFFICSFAVLWFAYSNTLWEGQVSRMLMGLTTSPAIIAALCLGTRWFKPHLFALIVSLTEFLALAGGVIGEAGLAQVVTAFGWRYSMLSVAGVGIILTALSYFIIHDYPDHDQKFTKESSLKATLTKTFKHIMQVISIKELWINGIYGGLLFGIFPAFAALWGVPYFIERYNISLESAALLASTYFFGACIGTLVLGWVSVYITKRRPIMIWGAFIAFLFSLSVIYIPSITVPQMYLLVFAFGFFTSTYALSFALASTYVTPSAKGVAMGFNNMLCIAFGAPLLQPLIGFLLKWTSDSARRGFIKSYEIEDYGIALAPISICALLAFVIAFFIKENSESDSSHH